MSDYLERASYNWSEDSVRLINTPSRQAKNTYFYMQEAGYFKTTPPYFTERRGLPSFLILYTLSGHGVLHYQSQEHILSEGKCFFINCMLHHDYAACAGDQWEFLWLHFYGASSLGYYREFERSGFHILDVQNRSGFESILRRIVAVNQEKQLFCELLTSNLIINLLTEILILNSTGQTEQLLVPDYVSQTAKYIDIHFKEDLSLDALASLQHISKYYLSREFKRYMGITLQEYLINSRINYAKELLKYTDQPVSEIAYACGMHNVSHFIHQFKIKENMTPLSYKSQWKEQNCQ